MDIENELAITIKRAIEELGPKRTEAIISKIFSSRSRAEEPCPTCGCSLDFLQISNTVLTKIICSKCRLQIQRFEGVCRTLRLSGNEGRRKISIRYYDNYEKEGLFEFYNCGYSRNPELKSRDLFSLTFTTPSERGSSKIQLKNHTTARVYEIEESKIYELKEQFPAR